MSRVFRIETESGPHVYLSHEFAHEIRDDERLSLSKYLVQELLVNIPGLEPFREGTVIDGVMQDAVRIRLTQTLGKLAEPLAEEADVALQRIWGESPEWSEVVLKKTMVDLIAQLSTRVFLAEMCRNEEWLQLSANYASNAFRAITQLRVWPISLRPFVHWFMPSFKRVRADVKHSRQMIRPVLAARKAEKEQAIKEGKQPRKYNDACEWMEEVAKGRPYDPSVVQLTFSFSAIHTTGDLITQVLIDLCTHPEYLEPLRQEIRSVVGKHGWTKTTIYNLALMDSFIKESQRLKPPAMVTMNRTASADIQLSEGTKLPKGSRIAVSAVNMWDPKIYPDPSKFDGYRFLNMRKNSENGNAAHFVTIGPNHLAFGLGKHACPGRFFVGTEVKVALCFLLLRYDMELSDAENSNPIINGRTMAANVFAKIRIRRREEDVPLIPVGPF
ncbi:related to gibberellin cluster-GA14-synthase [Rhynchosporium agropyri]|uniref:Related to gibberellin cluster-GA14-synthase n=1 Tax=Rhynchosporium agropyri TaxID=914238 RepID=A0A1E1LNX0_9HELO|nr:related to gibberellin cluster-GA14-synthase [Rhynchosporium agropyri]